MVLQYQNTELRVTRLRRYYVKVIDAFRLYDLDNIIIMITPLKKARKESNISLQDMAYILDMDTSNLSKYERGINYPTMRILLGYHILTKAPLRLVFKTNLAELFTSLSLKITNLISFLEEEVETEKISKRLTALNSLLDNISCLKDISEEEYE